MKIAQKPQVVKAKKAVKGTVKAGVKFMGIVGVAGVFLFSGWLFFDIEASSTARIKEKLMGLVDAIPSEYDHGGDLEKLADKIAKEEGIPPALFRALITQESAWDELALSHKGASGLTQLMPSTALHFCNLPKTRIFLPAENLRCGARYLGHLLEKFDDLELALAAYNSGPTRVARLGRVPRIKETQRYVKRIKELHQELVNRGM